MARTKKNKKEKLYIVKVIDKRFESKITTEYHIRVIKQPIIMIPYEVKEVESIEQGIEILEKHNIDYELLNQVTQFDERGVIERIVTSLDVVMAR